MKTFYQTDPGKVRSHNEDSVTIVNKDNKEFVLAIADGMGGHKGGQLAGELAVRTMLSRYAEDFPCNDPRTWLLEAAAPLLDGQELVFSADRPIWDGDRIYYYFDETILEKGAQFFEKLAENFR